MPYPPTLCLCLCLCLYSCARACPVPCVCGPTRPACLAIAIATPTPTANGDCDRQLRLRLRLRHFPRPPTDRQTDLLTPVRLPWSSPSPVREHGAGRTRNASFYTGCESIGELGPGRGSRPRRIRATALPLWSRASTCPDFSFHLAARPSGSLRSDRRQYCGCAQRPSRPQHGHSPRHPGTTPASSFARPGLRWTFGPLACHKLLPCVHVPCVQRSAAHRIAAHRCAPGKKKRKKQAGH